MFYAGRTNHTTHEVFNQPEPAARDLWATDKPLQHRAKLFGAHATPLDDAGAKAGAPAMREAGAQANRHPPKLRLFDLGCRRRDEVVFHPDYHRLIDPGFSAGLSAPPLRRNALARLAAQRPTPAGLPSGRRCN